MPRREPLPHLRRKRQLQRQYPHLETHELWKLAGLKTGYDQPLWVQINGTILRPVICRNDPRK